MAGISLKMRVMGSKKMEAAMKRNVRVFEPAVMKQITLAGEVVIGAARKEFKGSRTRSLYEISGGKRKLRAKPRAITSPPKQLGVFEGAYRKSISQDVEIKGPRTRRRWTTTVGPTVIYAAAHEFGKGNLPERQVLTPAIKKTQNKVFKIIGKAFKVLRI